jgi:benzoylformate decarboxylase
LPLGALTCCYAPCTAAKYGIPSVFIRSVNHEYRLLKDLCCNVMKTNFDTTRFVGMDFSDPNVDLWAIAEGFGARVETITSSGNAPNVLSRAEPPPCSPTAPQPISAPLRA